MKHSDRDRVPVQAIPAKPTRWLATTVAALPPLAASIVDDTEVEWLVQDVIICGDLPFTLLSVSPSPSGWNVMVRAATQSMIRFAVAQGRPAAVRSTIQGALDGARLN